MSVLYVLVLGAVATGAGTCGDSPAAVITVPTRQLLSRAAHYVLYMFFVLGAIAPRNYRHIIMLELMLGVAILYVIVVFANEFSVTARLLVVWFAVDVTVKLP